MTSETIQWLTENTLIGFTDKRGAAWHGREGDDNHFPGAVPQERALELLSYPVHEGTVQSVVQLEDSAMLVEDPDRKTIVRTDTRQILGIFKQGYRMHQPAEWCLQNLDLILSGGLEIGSVVVLKGGAVAAVQAELPENRIATGKGAEPVEYRPFVTAATSFDGSIATTYGRGAQVVVCDNTLSVALRNFDGVTKYRHSSGSLSRIGEVRENLHLMVEQSADAFDTQVRALTAMHVTDAKFAEIVSAFTGIDSAKEGRSLTMAEKKQDALLKLWRDDERVAPWRNNGYGVLAAFNTASHHIFGADASRPERNQRRVIEGGWDDFDSKILRMLELAY